MPAKTTKVPPLSKSRALLSLQSLIRDTEAELVAEREYAVRKANTGKHREARTSLKRVAALETWLAYLQGEFAATLAVDTTGARALKIAAAEGIAVAVVESVNGAIVVVRSGESRWQIDVEREDVLAILTLSGSVAA